VPTFRLAHVDAAIERLRQSKKTFLGAAKERGRMDGTGWAMDTAEYGQLKGLHDEWPRIETCKTNDSLGAPGVFLGMSAEDCVDRDAVFRFWENVGKVPFDEDLYSPEYWNGFVEGALEVFEKVDD